MKTLQESSDQNKISDQNFVFFSFLDGAYAGNSQPDPDFRQAVGPTAHHYPGLLLEVVLFATDKDAFVRKISCNILFLQALGVFEVWHNCEKLSNFGIC